MYDAIIIGAGAAGMMAAIEAGKKQKKVLVLEHNSQIGNKILISGGGRCNFTNINASPENYISSNSHFIKSAFSEYTPNDFIKLVESYGIEYYEKKLGQLFCKKSSREIINMLLSEAQKYKVEIKTNVKVLDVNKIKDFEIITSDGDFKAKKCIVSCGGLSFPKKGATDLGYKIGKKFGHKIIKTEPALVPLVLPVPIMKKLSELSGISFDSNLSLNFKNSPRNKNRKIKFSENTLITHRGLSGPAILQISSYWQKGDELKINIEPSIDISQLLESYSNSNKDIKNLLTEVVSSRFAEFLCNHININKPINQLSKKDKFKIIETFGSFILTPIDSEGYAKAEVTIGGIDTKDLNQKSMESNLVEGLYFIGEVVDVTGWLGGYNFQWAWASGYVCGRSI